MKRFAELLDRLSYEPGRNNKLRLMTDYFRHTGDPDRGYALAALTGSLSFQYAKPNVLRTLITDRTDPVLFGLSRDYVGDTSETIALMWPADPHHRPNAALTLSDVVATIATLGKAQLPAQLARWLDALDETGRWALLKLVTGALRVGVSARLAKTAAAALGDKDVQEIELLWPGLAPPLHRAVRLARRPRREAVEQRSCAVPSRDAGACDRGDEFRRARSGRLPRGMEMGRHPRAGVGRRSMATRASAGSIRAPARTSPRASPISSTRCASTARSTVNCWSSARAACRASTCCSSG